MIRQHYTINSSIINHNEEPEPSIIPIINHNTVPSINPNLSIKLDPSIINNIPFTYKEPREGEYMIHEIPNFLSNELCDQLIKYQHENGATLGKIHSSLFDEESSNGGNWVINPEVRHSYNVLLEHELADLLYEKIEDILHIKRLYIEPTKIIYYPTGGQFVDHYDVIPEDKRFTNFSRFMTVLFYLNDDYEGGETVFPYINKTIKPEKGKAIIMWLVRQSENGPVIIKESKHRSNKITKGEKYIMNVWFHTREFPAEHVINYFHSRPKIMRPYPDFDTCSKMYH
jgi:hypothetical protein